MAKGAFELLVLLSWGRALSGLLSYWALVVEASDRFRGLAFSVPLCLLRVKVEMERVGRGAGVADAGAVVLVVLVGGTYGTWAFSGERESARVAEGALL
jgi:hypothetical protein